MADIDLIDDDDTPELTVMRHPKPTGWTDHDRRRFDRALDLAGITDPAERVRLSMRADAVMMFSVISAARHADAWIDDLRRTFERVAGGEL